MKTPKEILDSVYARNRPHSMDPFQMISHIDNALQAIKEYHDQFTTVDKDEEYLQGYADAVADFKSGIILEVLQKIINTSSDWKAVKMAERAIQNLNK